MIDLPVANQPYPGKTPWYDIAQYLTPGLTPQSPQTVLAAADGNFVHYSVFVRVNRTHPDLEVNWLIRNLHPSLRPVSNLTATGWFSVGGASNPHNVQISPYGYMAMVGFPTMGLKLADFDYVSLTATAARRNP